jgi:hypothetical protein
VSTNVATTAPAPEHAPAPASDIVAELNGVVLHPDSTPFDRYVALNALHRIALGINARLDYDPNRRKRVRARQRADYVRASRTLAACSRLISREHRINHTEAEILAEVVALDHAEALYLGHAGGAA